MDHHPLHVSQVSQDILDRPADTRRRAIPIVRPQGGHQVRDLGPGLIGSGRQVIEFLHELILRTRFLASP